MRPLTHVDALLPFPGIMPSTSSPAVCPARPMSHSLGRRCASPLRPREWRVIEQPVADLGRAQPPSGAGGDDEGMPAEAKPRARTLRLDRCQPDRATPPLFAEVRRRAPGGRMPPGSSAITLSARSLYSRTPPRAAWKDWSATRIPFLAVTRAPETGSYDEIIVSALPAAWRDSCTSRRRSECVEARACSVTFWRPAAGPGWARPGLVARAKIGRARRRPSRRVARWVCARGRGRRCARSGAPRRSPRRPATDRAARHRPRTRSGAEVAKVGASIVPRALSRSRSCSIGPVRSGPEKPIAINTSSAGRCASVPCTGW